MNKLPATFLIDTNVAVTANMHTDIGKVRTSS